MVSLKNYPPEECAKDMEAGLNYYDSMGDETQDAILNRGGHVMLAFCPACMREGRKVHGLDIGRLGPHKFQVKAIRS